MIESHWESLLLSAQELLSAHAQFFIGALLFLLLLQTLRLTFLRASPGRRMTRHRIMGAEGERRARKLLVRSGFNIDAEQVSGNYRLMIDGESSRIHLRADFVVSRRGKTYIAEVKSGAASVKVTGRGTRRQLLEYLLAFDVDGILLVDMVEERIRQVCFPALK